MKRTSSVVTVVVLVLLALLASAGASLAQGLGPQELAGAGFTYQGQLKNAGGPVNATCDFEFSLWDAAGSGAPPQGGNRIGNAATVGGVQVTNGLFTAKVNAGGEFGGSAFTGERRWLQIAVRCPAGSGSLATLAPRQELTPAPVALALPGLRTEQNATIPSVIGGYSGNSAPGTGTTIAGGGMAGSSCGGFGNSSCRNSVTDMYGTIGGGYANTAGELAKVGGGSANLASGFAATVGGGQYNSASGEDSTVGGGFKNAASATDSVVGGGYSNSADGDEATVPGGRGNVAQGKRSFAAGAGAVANHDGAFVWSSDAALGFASTGMNQFLIAASGGVGINTNTPANQSLQVAKDFDGTGGFGQIEATGATNHNKRLTLGFDTTNNIGWIQASETGYAYRQLILNPGGGNVGVGTLIPQDKLDVNGTIRVGVLSAGESMALCRNVFNQLAWCSSSLRYKEQVAPLDLGLETVKQLRPVSFAWKESGQRDLGLVAEEVAAVAPLLTTRNDAGQIEGVKYDRLTAVLVKALQEQQSQIDELAARNAQLEARLAALEARPASSR